MRKRLKKKFRKEEDLLLKQLEQEEKENQEMFQFMKEILRETKLGPFMTIFETSLFNRR